MQKRAYSQKGNVLFIILIALVLFGALAYAITRSGLGKGNVDRETAVLQAGQLTQMLTSYVAGVDRLIADGCEPQQISLDGFEVAPNAGAGDTVNPNSPADRRCHLIDQVGGKAPRIPAVALDGRSPAPNGYGLVDTHRNFTVKGIPLGWSKSVVIMVPYLSNAVCTEINRKLFNVSSIPVTTGTTNNYQPWSGSWGGPGEPDCPGSALGNNLCGGEMGCFRMPSYDDYWPLTTQSNVNIAYIRVINGN
jgi:hypothetical protein